jgi:hypothetical protein
LLKFSDDGNKIGFLNAERLGHLPLARTGLLANEVKGCKLDWSQRHFGQGVVEIGEYRHLSATQCKAQRIRDTLVRRAVSRLRDPRYTRWPARARRQA